MVVDWALRVTIIDYRTGPAGQFMLPYSCLCRPALAVVRSARLRHVVAHFVKTVLKSRNVFVLTLSFLTVGAVGSLLLLQGRLGSDHLLGRGFDGAFVRCGGGSETVGLWLARCSLCSAVRMCPVCPGVGWTWSVLLCGAVV